jgi:hypothetical protein
MIILWPHATKMSVSELAQSAGTEYNVLSFM